MTFDYKYKITFNKSDDNLDINFVTKSCNNIPNDSVLLEVPDTSYLNVDTIRKLPNNIVGVRIVGAYDNDLLNNYKNVYFMNEKTGKKVGCKEYFYDSVIYTKNEAIKIIEEIESIERNMNPNWSDIQKIIYIYDTIKRKIFYDPKFESKPVGEIKSLRGLISKKTVCLGYSVIFKELLERQKIKCHLVIGDSVHKDGSTGGHAWNIIELDDKLYPIDLTWDNTKYRNGSFREHSYLANNIKLFNKQHKPDHKSYTYGMESNFSTFNPNLISYLSKQMSRNSDYTTTTFFGRRVDGTKYIVSQIGDAVKDGHKYYRYYYVDRYDDGTKGEPVILYSDYNVASFVNSMNFKMNENNKITYNNINDLIDNVLFSKKNIKDSLNKGTYYIGGLLENPDSNKNNYINKVSNIKKPVEKCDLFKYSTKKYKRSDGTVFIIQCTDSSTKYLDININSYSVIELIDNGKDKPNLIKNTIFSEGDLLNDQRKEFADVFLSRDRLDKITSQTGGYVGTFNRFGAIEYNQSLAEYFDISKYIGLDGKKQKQTTPLPSFEDLHDLIRKYEVVIDASYLANPDGALPKVCDRNTGEVVTDISTINKAYLANTWLCAAGIKEIKDEMFPGESYAFNPEAKKVYELICSESKKSAKNNGVIDTVDIFRRIDELTNYKHSHEIVSKLFKTPMQVKLFNKMTFDSLGMECSDKVPTPLYSLEYAGSLAFGKESTM